MEQLNMNTILNRTDSENQLKNILSLFELEKHLMATRRGVYIYGSPGTGKTCFVKDILKKLNYDVVLFDAGDFRNKTVIDTITKHNMADTNILSLFKKKTKKFTFPLKKKLSDKQLLMKPKSCQIQMIKTKAKTI